MSGANETAHVDDGFEPPAFGAPIDLDARLAACPEDATTLGTFFQYVHAAASRLPPAQQQAAHEGQPTLRWIAFKQYSLRDFMRLAYNTARAVHPSLPRGEGLRRIGWMSYPSFAATMAGRVVLFAFGDRIENVLTAAAKSYRLALPCATITTERIDERHYRLLMRDVPSFAETMHCGVLEGAIKEHGFEPEMLVRRGATPADVDFDIRWR